MQNLDEVLNEGELEEEVVLDEGQENTDEEDNSDNESEEEREDDGDDQLEEEGEQSSVTMKTAVASAPGRAAKSRAEKEVMDVSSSMLIFWIQI